MNIGIDGGWDKERWEGVISIIIIASIYLWDGASAILLQMILFMYQLQKLQ